MEQTSIEQLDQSVTDAENLWRTGRLAAAAEIYENILLKRLRETANDINSLTAADLVIIERLADLSILLGNSEAADSLLDGIGKLTAEAGNIFAADYIKIKRIHLAISLGKLCDAYKLFESMHATIGRIEDLNLAKPDLLEWEKNIFWKNADDDERAVIFSNIYLSLGQFSAANGQYINALTCFNRGLDFTSVSSSNLAQQVELHLEVSIMKAHVEKGDFGKADADLRKIAERQLTALQLGLRIQLIESRGKLALLRGELGAALEEFNEIQKICHDHHLSFAEDLAALNLVHVLISINQVTQALEILRDVHKRAQTDGNFEMVSRCEFLQKIAQLRADSGIEGVAPALSVSNFWRGDKIVKPRAAETIRIYDFEELNPDADFLTFFEDRALAFQFYLGAKDFEGAKQYLERITETFQDSDSILINLRLRIFKAMMAYYSGEFTTAEKLFFDCCEELEILKLRPELWQCRRFLLWCRAKLKYSSERQTILASQTQQLLDQMVGSLIGEDRVIFLLNKWTAEEESLAAQINHLMQLKLELQSVSWLKRLKLKNEIRRKLSGLTDHINFYKTFVANRFTSGVDGGVAAPPQTSVWDRLWNHPFFRTTISFLVLPDRIVIVRQNWMKLDFGVSGVTRIKLRDAVKNWHQAMLEGLKADASQDANLEDLPVVSQNMQAFTRELADALQLTDLLKNLPRWVNSLTFVPDDCLHGLPFAALRFEDKYLIEKFRINIAFNNGSTEKARPSKSNSKALVVGVSKGSTSFAALKGVRKEIEQVRTWLEKNRIDEQRVNDFEDSAQTPGIEVIKGLLSTVTLAHIACHGIFEPDDVNKTGLLLNPQLTEILNLREISKLNLSGLQHITLSSCWAADHFVFPGRWIVGLPETLCRAGTDSLLGSLWTVHDRSATVLIEHFYDKLKRLPRDEALRQAQLEFLHNKKPEISKFDLTNPFFWAGFTLYGCPERLKL